MRIEHIYPDSLFHAEGFGQVVIAPPGRLVFIAGQAPLDRQFQLIGGEDLHAQTVFTFQNLRAALAAAGADPSDVVSSIVYIVGLNPARVEIFSAAMSVALDGHPFPPNALSMIGVSSLAGPQLIEISAIAAIPGNVPESVDSVS